jgi:homoserine O-acetyltransferase/O-succinyltransferase
MSVYRNGRTVCAAALPALGLLVLGLLGGTGGAALAQDKAAQEKPAQAVLPLVEKQSFTIADFTAHTGAKVANMKIGWEAYGKLNADKSNAVLICHFFSGSSHAAGKYADDDKAAGYWDAIIGPGKAIDTDKYYVVSADTPANLNPFDPKVITTGPATIDPSTGKPYGLRFPQMTVADFVDTQKALLDSLGIKKLAAVAGASMGSLQAVVWSARYPEMTPKVIAVISPGLKAHPYTIAMLKGWMDPILLDPAWANGDYDPKSPPARGLSAALQMVTVDALQTGWAERFKTDRAKPDADPADSLTAQYKIEAFLDEAGAARAKNADANHFLYLTKASQTMDVSADIGKIKAKFLFLPAAGDLLFPPEQSAFWAEELKKQGLSANVKILAGPLGHLNGVNLINQAAAEIKSFIEE